MKGENILCYIAFLQMACLDFKPSTAQFSPLLTMQQIIIVFDSKVEVLKNAQNKAMGWNIAFFAIHTVWSSELDTLLMRYEVNLTHILCKKRYSSPWPYFGHFSRLQLWNRIQ